jgi:hypothetical protein
MRNCSPVASSTICAECTLEVATKDLGHGWRDHDPTTRCRHLLQLLRYTHIDRHRVHFKAFTVMLHQPDDTMYTCMLHKRTNCQCATTYDFITGQRPLSQKAE